MTASEFVIPPESYTPLSPQGRPLGIRQKVTDVAAREADNMRADPSTSASDGLDCNFDWHPTEEQLRVQLQQIDSKLDLICTLLRPPPNLADFTVPQESHAKFEAGSPDVTPVGTNSPTPSVVQDARSAVRFRGLDRFADQLSKRPDEHHEDVCAAGTADKAAGDVSIIPSLPFMDASANVGAQWTVAAVAPVAPVAPKGPTFVCKPRPHSAAHSPASSRGLVFDTVTGTTVSLDRKRKSSAELEMAYRGRHGEDGKSFLERLVTSATFDSFITCVVLLNVALLGAIVHHNAVSDSPPPAVYDYIEYVCVGIFTIELALRVAGQRCRLLESTQRYWAALDVFLVSLSWAEVLYIVAVHDGAERMENASLARILKVARMCRVFRAFRMFRFLLHIRIMVIQIAGSLNALGWFFLLLCFILYLFAVVITSGATSWLKPEDDAEAPLLDAQYETVQDMYGGVHQTMYTLFMCITSGVSWGEAGTAIQATGQFYFVVFCVFIFTATFSVLNIITGVFVDSAIQQAETDRVVRLQKAQRAKKDMENALTDLFDRLDIDHDNFITEQEWMFACTQPQVKQVLASLEIGGMVGEELFDLLDIDHDGVLRCSEFTDGLTMIRGAAKSVDLYKVHADVRVVAERLNVLLSRIPEDPPLAPKKQ